MWSLAAFDVGQGPKLYAGTDNMGVMRWSGSAWQLLAGLNGHVGRLLVHDDGSGAQLYAVGNFTGAGIKNIARWNGVAWSNVGAGPGADHSPRGIGEYDDGSGHGNELWIGGDLTAINGVATPKLAVWDGANWRVPGVVQGISATYPGVSALRGWNDGVHPRPVLAAGGNFKRAGVTPANYVAIWDGVSWSALASGTDNQVQELATWIDPVSGVDSLYAGGAFTTAGGVSSRGIARWDGSAWSALGSGVDGGVSAIVATDAPQLGGPSLFVGGYYPSASGLSTNSIARWDGSTWHALGGGVAFSGSYGGVSALIVWDDPSSPAGPELFVGGGFDAAGGVSTNWAARWDGASWSAMDAGLNAISPGLIGGFAIYNAGAGNQLFAVDYYGELLRWDGTTWMLVSGAPTQPAPPSMLVYDDGTGPAIYTGNSRWNGVSWSSLGQLNVNGFVSAHASLSSRLGGPSALWIGGKALVRIVTEQALASKAKEVIVVTGHQAEQVEKAFGA